MLDMEMCVWVSRAVQHQIYAANQANGCVLISKLDEHLEISYITFILSVRRAHIFIDIIWWFDDSSDKLMTGRNSIQYLFAFEHSKKSCVWVCVFGLFD